MAVTAIIFDLDETLIADDDATAEALDCVCSYAHHQRQIDPAQLQDAVYRHSRRLWHSSSIYAYCHSIGISASEGLWGYFVGSDPNLQALHAWAPRYQHEVWRSALAEQGIEDSALADNLAAQFREQRRACQFIFSEVLPILQDLHKQYRLALLTNGAPDLQHEKIASLNLSQYFDAVVVSGEVGVGKPDPAVFSAVLNKLEVRPNSAIMVGDSLPRDIAGAAQSGLRNVWINRRQVACHPDYAARINAEIFDLRGLYDVL
jgi:putative hydrolase of the HAD superfamily